MSAEWIKFSAASHAMSPRAKNILLIEDHADSATVFARVLQTYGHTVTVAHCVSEAERACEQGNFDLLLCDIELPDGNGLDLLRRARMSCPTSQGIVISAHEDEGRRRAAKEAGFKEYLVKPFRAEDLRAAMTRVEMLYPPQADRSGTGPALPSEDH